MSPFITTNAGMHFDHSHRILHSHNVINVHPAHYGWPCTNNGKYSVGVYCIISYKSGLLPQMPECTVKGVDCNEHSHNVIRIQNVHPAHYGWPCTKNGQYSMGVYSVISYISASLIN